MRDYVIDIVQRHVDQRIRKSGDQNISCRCPFHKGGQESNPSFSVNVELGLFNCFTCHESGTLVGLLKLLGLPPTVIDAELGPIRGQLRDNIKELKLKRKAEFVTRNPYRAPCILSEAFVDAYRWCPQQLTNLGFDIRWLQYMEVGVDRVNRRITYPVRDIYGNLAGFVGGRTDGNQLPKYKVYQGKTVLYDGKVRPSDYGPWFDEEYPNYQFRNHDYLWNYDKVYPRMFFSKEVGTLIIVEGFKACLWLLQHGYRNVVALMGSTISRRQMDLILRLRTNVLLFLDNNEAGQEGTYTIGEKLHKMMPSVHAVNYPPNVSNECQPDDFDAGNLYQVVGSAPMFRNWKRERNHKWV